MSDVIAQRELRSRTAAILRRVEAGDSFVVTRHGRSIAHLVPHACQHEPSGRTIREFQAVLRGLAPLDAERWKTDREHADERFGDDDPAGP